ncbi:DUF4232 domain-containing protein [Streptomyces monticola]|uniref:DUF4232 domain-containing protein n=1 Tax=Streptomyces monticola TaxID=2666263 RepID=A0ABW2JAY3_9ACTN
MRSVRKTWKSYALGVAAVAALLSSTACEPGTDDGAAGDPSGSPSASSSAKPGGGGDGGDSGKSGGDGGKSGGVVGGSEGSGGSGDTGGGSEGGGGADDGDGAGTDDAAKCHSDNMELSVAEKNPNGTVPVLLVTATNVGDETCWAWLPELSFDDSRPTRIEESTQPQAVVSIEPGASAYAGISTSALSEEGGKGFDPDSVSVGFAYASEGDEADVQGPHVTLELPKSVRWYSETSARATFWQQKESDALNW